METAEEQFIELSSVIAGTMRLGKWGANYDTAQLQEFIEGCIELGVTSFDHADIYGDYTTEADFGQVLKAKPELRDRVEIITKCGICRVCEQRPEHKHKSYDSSAEHIVASVDASLKALNTEYIDMLLLHRPDYLMDPDDVAEAFEHLNDSGKVETFGVSNFSPSQFELLHDAFPLVTNQVEISILKRDSFDNGVLDQCLLHGIQPMAWSPLGGGALFEENPSEEVQRIRDVASRLSKEKNAGIDELLLAWLMKHPAGILPVLGTSKLERVASAVTALEVELSRAEWYELWQAALGHDVA